MKILKKSFTYIFAIVIYLTLVGCGEVKEQKSDLGAIVDEKQNELPKSTLTPADKNLEQLISQTLPQIKKFQKLTKELNKTQSDVTLDFLHNPLNHSKTSIKVD